LLGYSLPPFPPANDELCSNNDQQTNLTAIAKRCGQSTTQYIASRIREKIAEDQAGGRNGSRCWIY